MNLTINEVSQALNAGECGSDGSISSVVIDNRKAKKDSLFIAIKGENHDGHDFIFEAVKAGACAVVCEKKPEGLTVPCITVKDTRQAIMSLAKYYRDKFNINTVGITGSVGKTTTKEMIATVLESKFKTLKTKGNFNNEIGLPLTLFELDDGYEAAVIEMGMSNFGEISRLSKTASPSIGVITNIGVSHIESLGSKKGILKAKLEILDGMEYNAPLFLNGDDLLLKGYKSTQRKIITFGVKNKRCNYRACNITQHNNKTTFYIKYKNNRQKIILPCIGEHNVLNAVCAFAIADKLKINAKKAAEALLKYVPAGMRQNIVNINGMTIIEDCYNASPDSMKAALSTLGVLKCKGKKIAVLSDMLELGEISRQTHLSFGKMIKKNADILFSYGDFAKYYTDGAKKHDMQACYYFEDKRSLCDTLLGIINKGDIILFKGSRGMHLEKIMAEVYERSSD